MKKEKVEELVQTLGESIEKIEEQEEEVKEKSNAYLKHYGSKKKIYQDIMDMLMADKLDRERYIKTVMRITCFNSLAFCCRKNCDNRNLALQLLGLSLEDFMEIKKNCTQQFIERAKEKM